MKSNIGRVLERGDKLEDLEEKSSQPLLLISQDVDMVIR
jgi:hypothetical protein